MTANRHINLSTKEAADIIGCCPQHVRLMIKQGKLKAESVGCPTGIYYLIELNEVRRVAKLSHDRGRPRGARSKRKSEGEKDSPPSPSSARREEPSGTGSTCTGHTGNDRSSGARG